MVKKKPADATSTSTFDKRVVDRNVARGSISRTELEARLKALPDLADQADNIADKIYGNSQGNAS